MIDQASTSKAYWDGVLRSENLDMSRGRTIRDEFAEGMYCSMLADKLSEQGQVIPNRLQMAKIGARQIDPLSNLENLDKES